MGWSVADKWLRDDTVEMCTKYHVKFSLSEWRHHCRKCGHVFCSRCSRSTLNCAIEDPPSGVGVSGMIIDTRLKLYLPYYHMAYMVKWDGGSRERTMGETNFKMAVFKPSLVAFLSSFHEEFGVMGRLAFEAAVNCDVKSTCFSTRGTTNSGQNAGRSLANYLKRQKVVQFHRRCDLLLGSGWRKCWTNSRNPLPMCGSMARDMHEVGNQIKILLVTTPVTPACRGEFTILSNSFEGAVMSHD
ncbi:hypothetical protein DAPPUDRAFT_100993 [Daphnia pulex]|uniref:FYVE-type domain-containing protein n=1 Tax=Daphnia pulex TaxID=6669 RepID=E9GBW7_DAPPU|nr:hypothetical protein DAPPUDRAFT_100993 [Daphnia pulex]|eukprot:EFX83030.1 hypothetical protein DAPPUDRAFT_100993 [Daphnia pulex]